LHSLAIHRFQVYAEDLSIFEIFDAIKADFMLLTRVDPNGWVRDFLREKVQAAFEKDHSVFRNEALLETLDNVVLGKVLMKWVVEMYDEKVLRMIQDEKGVRVVMKKSMEIPESEGTRRGADEQELVTPVVEERYAQETSEHGSVHTEGFRTISCPSDEGRGSEDCVMVDAIDLSGSVEQANDGWEDTYLLTGEAVSAEPEHVPVEEEPAVDLLAGLSKSQRYKLRKRMQREVEEAAAESIPQEDVKLGEDEEARLREEDAVAVAIAAVAELESVKAERERKLRKKMKMALKKMEREEAAKRLRQKEAEAEMERPRQEEARIKEEEDARLRGKEVTAEAAAMHPDSNPDAEPKICPLRAKHLTKKKKWMGCALCRAAVQHMAARLSRTNVVEETLQDLEKELVN
jgi:hypothetical protein